jgi:hypothetical protein
VYPIADYFFYFFFCLVFSFLSIAFSCPAVGKIDRLDFGFFHSGGELRGYDPCSRIRVAPK